jgi:hypothetical protein
MQPLLQLKLLGTLCPCLAADPAARNAAWSLSAVRVRWQRRIALSPSSATSSVTGLFSMFSSSTATEEEAVESVDGMMSVVDTNNGPSLTMGDFAIPLRHITSILVRNGIEVTSTHESITFHILTEDGIDADECTTNEVYDNLQILFDWEKCRQEALLAQGITEEDQYPSQTSSNVLTDKAKKIQHFAQREIELQKIKREREARKAKYVKEAGGLKYTAIAMANRT